MMSKCLIVQSILTAPGDGIGVFALQASRLLFDRLHQSYVHSKIVIGFTLNSLLSHLARAAVSPAPASGRALKS